MKRFQTLLAKAALLTVVGLGLSACATQQPEPDGYYGYYEAPDYYGWPDYYGPSYYAYPPPLFYGSFFFFHDRVVHRHHHFDGHHNFHDGPRGGFHR